MYGDLSAKLLSLVCRISALITRDTCHLFAIPREAQENCAPARCSSLGCEGSPCRSLLGRFRAATYRSPRAPTRSLEYCSFRPRRTPQFRGRGIRNCHVCSHRNESECSTHHLYFDRHRNRRLEFRCWRKIVRCCHTPWILGQCR